MDKFLSVQEASKMLGVSTITLRRFTKSKIIPCYKIGSAKNSKIKYKEQDILDFIESKKIG